MKNLFNFKRKKGSFLISLFVLVLLGGYTIFFASPYYMTDVGDAKVTPLNQINKLENSREVQLLSWTYCKEQKTMEVELQISNTSFDGRNTYDFAALFRPSNKEVEIVKIIEETNYVVAQIHNVPDNWKQISLRIFVSDNPNTPLKLYSNVEVIEKADNIETLSRLDYHLRRINRNIQLIDNQLKDTSKEISNLQEKITNIKATNLKLEDDKKYQTLDEIEKTNAQILENEKTIENTLKEIDKLKEQQQTLLTSKKDAEERLETLKNEKNS